MNVTSKCDWGSFPCYSDSEVDENGNLKGFVVDDTLSESEMDLVSRNHQKPRSSKRLKKLRKKKSFKQQNGISEEDDQPYLPFEHHSSVLKGKIFKEISSDHTEIIVGREEEARRILTMIMQPGKGMRPLLLGTPGIGKNATVKKVSMLMKTLLKDHPLGLGKIYCLDCKELLADNVSDNLTTVVGKKMREIIEMTFQDSKWNPIFFFRHIDKILHLDHVTEYLQSVLSNPRPFIASISDVAKSETAIKAEAILSKYNFHSLSIEESPIDDVRTIVKNALHRKQPYSNLAFTEEAIDLGVRLAAQYEHSQPFPIKGINLIQECANNILLQKLSSGMEVERMIITPKEIAEMVSIKTKIPANDLMEDSVFNQKRFEELLKSRIIGQDYAVKIVTDRVAVYKMNLVDNKKPWGVFLFVGPTGVGKTELAKSLAKLLFDDEANLMTINGSEYKEEHTVSNLIGSPKGYEGNESGGLLTEPLLKNPHQVVLLDEFEKAHQDVQRLFLQVFDGGPLIDRRGKRVNCSHALFIMTSNVGSEMLCEAASRGGLRPEDVAECLIPLLTKTFSPELVGRFKRGIVPFQPLNKQLMPEVARVKLKIIKERLIKEAEIDLSWTPELVNHFASLDMDLGFGMREFCNMIDETIVNLIKDAGQQSKKRIKGKLELTYHKNQEQFFLKIKNI